jgi:chromosome segregation ATPase
MNEETTKELPNKLSFEERIFARFDAMDARFDTVDARFDAVDARFNTVEARLEKLEARAYDTKPIWEKALAAIMQTGLEVGEIKAKVAGIETEIAGMKTDYAGIRSELTEMKRDLKYKVNKSIDLILEFLVEGRTDLRDAEDRLKQLETKLA